MRPFAIDEPNERPAWPFWPVALGLAMCWLVLGWPWLSGAVTIPWDAKAHFQPQIQFLAQSLARGESPFWTPFVFSGHPQIADPQSLIFSPPFLILALFDNNPSLRAADTTVLVTILTGSFALLLYFRDQRWHWGGALLAALGFGFGAAMAWRIQHTGQVLSLAYLPVTLLCLSRALAQRSTLYGVAAGVTAAAIVLGRDQVALLSVYLLVGFVTWHWLTARAPASEVRFTLPGLATGAIAGALVVALPVLMTILIAADSNRPEIDYVGAGRGSLHPALLLTLFAPDVFGSSGEMADYWGPPSMVWRDTGLFIAQNVGQLYIGAIPALLLLIGAITGVAWAREIRFFSVALLVMLVYALGWYTPLFKLIHATVPGVDLYRRPADAVFLIGLLAAMVAGYTFGRIVTATLPPVQRWQWLVIAALVAAAFAFALHIAVDFDRLSRALTPLTVAGLILLGGASVLAASAWIYPLRPVLASSLVALFTVGDLAWSNGPGSATALPPNVYDVLEPASRNDTIALLKAKVDAGRTDTRRDRVELLGLGFHWPNASLTHGLENTLGYNPIRLNGYARATGAEDHSISTADRKFPPLFPSYRSPLADLLGLRYIASGSPIETADKSLKPGDLKLIARSADAFIYENPRAFPRVMFATSAQRADFEALLSVGIWPDLDFSTTVLLEDIQSPATLRRPGLSRIRSYRNTEVVVEADSPDGGYVVLNDIWHPWWSAEIDGRATDLLKANVLFRAVAVPPGKHTVRFVFQPLFGAIRDAMSRSALRMLSTSIRGRER